MIEKFLHPESINTEDVTSFFSTDGSITVKVLRLDKLHPVVSGNKYFKLKYNIFEAKKIASEKILSFGGAYSNHIRALAFAAMKEGIEAIGVIRGDELDSLNYSLKYAALCGMKFHFVTREEYRLRNNVAYLEGLKQRFGDSYIVPEGGSNNLAVMGCAEIIDYIREDFNFIAVSCGSGGTAAGLLEGLSGHKNLLIFPALKQFGFLADEINRLNYSYNKRLYTNFEFVSGYDFGGYAKRKRELTEFIRNFEEITGIPVDFVYTGKLFYGINEEIKKGRFKPGEKIIIIHTGGYFYDVDESGEIRKL